MTPPILQVTDFEVRNNPKHPECAASILFVLHEGLCWKVELSKAHGLRLALQLEDLLCPDAQNQEQRTKNEEPSQ